MTEQEKLDIISDFENAEALYHFVTDNAELYLDYNTKWLEKPLSIAEYVLEFQADEFIKYLELWKGFIRDYERKNTSQ